MSISRSGGSAHTCPASSTSSSVTRPIAETTATTRSPDFLRAIKRSATARIRSVEPTEVPPNLVTTVAIDAPDDDTGRS